MKDILLFKGDKKSHWDKMEYLLKALFKMD